MTQRALRTHVHARVLKKLQACCSQLCTAGLGKALLGHVQYLCFTTATWHSSPRSARCGTAKRKETTKVVLDTICDNLLTAYPISAHCSRASRITINGNMHLDRLLAASVQNQNADYAEHDISQTRQYKGP